MNTHQWLAALADKSQLLFFVADAQHDTFLFLNPAFRQIIKAGGTHEQPSAVIQHIHADDQAHVAMAYERWKAGEQTGKVEFRMQWPGEPVSWWAVSAFRSSDPGNDSICYGYLEDISVLREQLEILRKYANKKNSVLNILSHDLAGPIGTVQNAAQLLARRPSATADPSIAQGLEMIIRQCSNSVRLIQQFIQQEFLDSTATQVMKSRVDMVIKIREMLQEYHKPNVQPLPAISMETNAEAIFIQIDEPKFLQVLSNLLSNAIKFTPDTGSIIISLTDKPDSLLIAISDTGIGIPEQFHSTIFEKFSLARRTGLKGESSVGLGMSIIKTIVDWHEGRIWLQSTIGKGTTFYIELPK